jgi:thioredoxin-like negative regulator of GroEL
MSQKKGALVARQSPGVGSSVASRIVEGLASPITRIVEVRTHYHDRCHARETVQQMYTEALHQADRQGKRAYAAFEEQLKLAELLVRQGAVEQAVEVLRMGTQALSQMNTCPALPASFDGEGR